jgi:hypothetical protein
MVWVGKPFEVIGWRERIIRDLFGILKLNGHRQFNFAYFVYTDHTCLSPTNEPPALHWQQPAEF